MKFQVCIIAGNAKTNSFMAGFDLTDRGTKAFMLPKFIAFDLERELGSEAENKLVNLIKYRFVSYGNKVAAVFFVGKPETAIIDHTIKTISDGKKWFVLDDFLRAHGAIEVVK
jgi:hypothetical protein